jgi:ubiquinone/menaquinone biosynthesis C-methylase UbiE
VGGLYTELAEYYDIVYAFKDYRKETARLVELARHHVRSGGRDWLDVACGTGGHLRFLASRFRCTGVDASPAMLRIARRKVLGVRFIQGDMRSFRLGKQFDVVSCLFSAIGHVRTRTGLRRAIRRMADHLKPGGVLLIEPWITPGAWRAGMVHSLTATAPGLTIARVSYSGRRGSESILRMHHLIGRKGRGVRYLPVTELSGLFGHATTLLLLRRAGLRPRFLGRGLDARRGLFVATKPRGTVSPAPS